MSGNVQILAYPVGDRTTNLNTLVKTPGVQFAPNANTIEKIVAWLNHFWETVIVKLLCEAQEGLFYLVSALKNVAVIVKETEIDPAAGKVMNEVANGGFAVTLIPYLGHCIKTTVDSAQKLQKNDELREQGLANGSKNHRALDILNLTWSSSETATTALSTVAQITNWFQVTLPSFIGPLGAFLSGATAGAGVARESIAIDLYSNMKTELSTRQIGDANTMNLNDPQSANPLPVTDITNLVAQTCDDAIVSHSIQLAKYVIKVVAAVLAALALFSILVACPALTIALSVMALAAIGLSIGAYYHKATCITDFDKFRPYIPQAQVI